MAFGEFIHPTVVIVLIQCFVSTNGRTCEPLQPHQNLELTCLSTNFNSEEENKTDCSLPQESGTTAYYSCKAYYVPFDSKSIIQELHCDNNGMWQGYTKYASFRCKEDCGNPILNAEPLVINGVSTNRTNHPWHAMLFLRSQKKGWIYLCGGSIIRNQVILTAAHCIATTNKNINDPKFYRVVLGGVSTKFSENTPISTGSQIHSVQRIYVSENYDPRKGYQADIAILQLDEQIEYTDYISPVCLPNDYSVDVSVIRNGVQGEIAGFGITEDGTVPDTLRVIQLNVKSNAECYNSLRRVLSESQFCAGSKSDEIWQTVCNGDSGNGMTFPSTIHQKFFVHGIVSSSDADARKGLCQNYAVFTRVYPFVFWIRDIIEEISGEAARDLNSNVPYPYVFAGTETQVKLYTGLPREWENRITRLEIRYAYVNLNEVVNSLEYAKPITSINFNSIILNTPGTKRRVVLPLLSDFTLDNLAPEMKIDNSRTFPNSITSSFLKNYLFFDKDYDNRNWVLSSLLSIKTDINLILSIFRIFHLNNAKGEIFLNSPQFTSELFNNFKDNPEFELKNLALHKTQFDISQISTASTLISLTLTKVKLIGKTTDLSRILYNFPNLKTLILDLVSNSRTTTNNLLAIDDLPSNLEYLTLFNSMQLASVNVEKLYSFRIIFPDQEMKNRNNQENSQIPSMKNLKTFCCDFCNVDTEIWKKFQNTFPNITVLMLRTDDPIDIRSIINSSTLKYLHLESSTRKNLSNYINLKVLLGGNIQENNAVRFERIGSSWKNIDVTNVDIQRGLFACSGGIYFWTSEEEYRSRYRLRTFEREAYNSNNYKFDGSTSIQNGRKLKFVGIPNQIQSELSSIILSNIEVTPRILSDSIKECKALKTISLINTSVVGNGRRYTFDTQNLTLELGFDKILGFDFEYVYEWSNGKLISAIVPFQNVGRFNESNIYSNTLTRLFMSINSARLQDSEATLYGYDSNVGELRASVKHIREVFDEIPESHRLHRFDHNIRKLQKIYKEGILPPEWEFPGLQVINQALVQKFYSNNIARIFGNVGFLRFVLKRYGKHIALASLSLSALQNQTNSFPPVQAIALSLIKDTIT